VSEHAICDLCNTAVARPSGCVFYEPPLEILTNQANLPGMKIKPGPSLWCDDCTARLVAAASRSEPSQPLPELSGPEILANPQLLREALQTQRVRAILDREKQLGRSGLDLDFRGRKCAQVHWNEPERVELAVALEWLPQHPNPRVSIPWRGKPWTCAKCGTTLRNTDWCGNCGAFQHGRFVAGLAGFVVGMGLLGLLLGSLFTDPLWHSLATWLPWSVALVVLPGLFTPWLKRPALPLVHTTCPRCGSQVLKSATAHCPHCDYQDPAAGWRVWRWIVALGLALVLAGLAAFCGLATRDAAYFWGWGGLLCGSLLLLCTVAVLSDLASKQMRFPPAANLLSVLDDFDRDEERWTKQSDLETLWHDGHGQVQRALAESWGPNYLRFQVQLRRETVLHALKIRRRVALGELSPEQGDRAISQFRPAVGDEPDERTA